MVEDPGVRVMFVDVAIFQGVPVPALFNLKSVAPNVSALVFELLEDNVPAVTVLPFVSRVPVVKVMEPALTFKERLSCNWTVPPAPLTVIPPGVLPPDVKRVVPEVPVNIIVPVEPVKLTVPANFAVTPFPSIVKATLEFHVNV